MTGCRRSEVLNLRWRDIGEDAINLADSKTGPRAVPLGEAARALIEALPGARKTDVFLFPRHAAGRGEWSLTNCWRTVCADAELGRLRLHDLRHTAASQAVMAGENLPHRIVGIRPGEKLHEVLITEDDSRTTVASRDRYVIEPPFGLASRARTLTDVEPVSEGFRYTSDTNEEWLDEAQMRRLIETA